MSGLYVYTPRPVLFPWYEKRRKSSTAKERLECGVLRVYDTSHWLKVGRGLDDFRYGPPLSSTAILQPVCKRPAPPQTTSTIASTREAYKYLKEHQQKPYSAYRALARRIEKIEEYESTPLKVLPLLEKKLPPEVFKQLIKVLQDPNAELKDMMLEDPLKSSFVEHVVPDLNMKEMDNESVAKNARKKNFRKLWIKSADHLTGRKISRNIRIGALPSDEKTVTAEGSDIKLFNSTLKISPLLDNSNEGQGEVNPYKSFVKKTVLKEPVAITRQKTSVTVSKPAEEALSLHEIANDFCKWTQELTKEGEPVNLDPERLITMFAVSTDYSGIVTTVRVLDKMSIPKDICDRTSDTTLSQNIERAPKTKTKIKMQKSQRSRYGAWYLDVKLWKETANNKLEHPDDIKVKRAKVEKLRTDHHDHILKNLYIVNEFRAFSAKTFNRIPKIINFNSSSLLKKSEEHLA